MGNLSTVKLESYHKYRRLWNTERELNPDIRSLEEFPKKEMSKLRLEESVSVNELGE